MFADADMADEFIQLFFSLLLFLHMLWCMYIFMCNCAFYECNLFEYVYILQCICVIVLNLLMLEDNMT